MNNCEKNGDNLCNSENESCNSTWSSMEDASAIKMLSDSFDLEKGLNSDRLREDENYNGFDNNVGETWVYPINKPKRDYQFNISKNSLFKNTLVVLPTGLGKTFIAAVVMYNIYRWYPNGKIIFMAPTRPLVTQQIDVCCKIMGIPKRDIVEMTGKINRSYRGDEWRKKKIFFATPQIVQKDLSDSKIEFPFKHIKLIVVDEAHKAKGKYAYVEVIQLVNEINKNFRVLALTATPGRSITDVLEVIRNLLISNIEVRYENSIDVSPFIHKKNIKIIAIPLGKQLLSIREQLINIIDPYTRSLIDDEVISNNVCNMSKGWLIMEQKKFRERSTHQRHINHSKVSLNFSICISLYHALELLERHGTRVLLNYFDEDSSEKEKFFVKVDQNIKNFVEKLRQQAGKDPLLYNDNPMPNGDIPTIPIDLDFGHPKFEYAKNILMQHFQEKPESKAMIFCEFRESVMLIHRMLLQNRPIIKPKCFVGQGGTGSIRAVTQTQQLKVMRDFREGLCNTLIATSVAEEGIDVGEVDLIICFDISTKNPVRLIQRVGRTGRERQGQVIMLATEGKEYLVVKEVLANKDKTNSKLMKCREIKQAFYKKSPRMIPPEFDPECIEVFMKELINDDKTQKSKQITKKDKNKKTQLKDTCFQKTDVRGYFKKVQPFLSQEELAIFDMEEINKKDCKSEENTVLQIQKEIAYMDNFCEDYVATQLENTMHENEIRNTSANRKLENKCKKINYMARQLGKDIKTPDYTKNLDELVKSKDIHKYIKKYVLLKNGEYVKEKFDAVKLILAGDKENDVRKKSINSTEKGILETFESIKDILGNKIEIECFIESYEKTKRREEVLLNFKKRVTKNILDSFEGLKIRKPFEVLDDILNNHKEADVLKFCSIDVLNIANNSSKDEKKLSQQAILSDVDLDFEYSECDSKYASQWNLFNDIRTESHSTPNSKLSDRPLSSRNIFREFPNNEFAEKATSTPKLLSNLFLRKTDQELLDINSTLRNQNQTPYNNSGTNSGEIKNDLSTSHKICEKKLKCEFSADLFDEDFDFSFTESENIEQQCDIKNYEKIDSFLQTKSHCNDKKKDTLDLVNKEAEIKFPVCNQNEYNIFNNDNKIIENSSKSKEKEIDEQTMISISQILEIVGTKEPYVNQLDVTNPELEDFDINDFAEPFEEEKRYVSIVDKAESLTQDFSLNKKDDIENLNIEICSKLKSPYLEDEDGKQPIITHSNAGVNIKTITTTLNSLNDSLVKKTKPSISPKCKAKINDAEIHGISPSLIKRTTSRLKLNGCENNIAPKFLSCLKLNINEKNVKSSNYDVSKDGSPFNKTQNNDSTLKIKPTKNKFRRLFNSDSSDLESDICKNESQSSNVEVATTPLKRQCLKNRQRLRAKRRKRLKRCDLIDNEAAHSSSNSQETEGDNEFNSDAYDSIVVDDETENFLDSRMYLKYIQTTKTPQRNCCFKIPSPRQYNDLSKIISQPINEMDELLDCYDGSFIASEEEFSENEEKEMSPLSKAEAILRKRKREKSKKKLTAQNYKKRRRILNEIIEISDDEKG